MLRTALKPRWLGLFLLVVVIVVTCVELGFWQLHVAQDKGLAAALQQAHRAQPMAVATILTPQQPFPNSESGRPVTADGTYAASGQVIVGPRRLRGRTGYWVLTPLSLTSGTVLPVVRGFVVDPSAVQPPPPGRISLDGSLAPGESPADPPALPAGAPPALGSVDLSILVNRWPGPLYNAFVFAQDEKTSIGQAVAPTAGLQRVPPPEVSGGLQWRNAAYAVQWWMFAGFALFMWFRMVRDDARRD